MADANSQINTIAKMSEYEDGDGYGFDYDYLMPPSIDGYYYFEGDIDNILEPWKTATYFVPAVIIYTLAFITGIIGNTLVVFVMVGDRKSRSVTTLFLVSLATADLLFLLICAPCDLIKHFFFNKITVEMCKILGFIEVLTGMGSVFNLMAVSIER